MGIIPWLHHSLHLAPVNSVSPSATGKNGRIWAEDFPISFGGFPQGEKKRRIITNLENDLMGNKSSDGETYHNNLSGDNPRKKSELVGFNEQS